MAGLPLTQAYRGISGRITRNSVAEHLDTEASHMIYPMCGRVRDGLSCQERSLPFLDRQIKAACTLLPECIGLLLPPFRDQLIHARDLRDGERDVADVPDDGVPLRVRRQFEGGHLPSAHASNLEIAAAQPRGHELAELGNAELFGDLPQALAGHAEAAADAPLLQGTEVRPEDRGRIVLDAHGVENFSPPLSLDGLGAEPGPFIDAPEVVPPRPIRLAFRDNDRPRVLLLQDRGGGLVGPAGIIVRPDGTGGEDTPQYRPMRAEVVGAPVLTGDHILHRPRHSPGLSPDETGGRLGLVALSHQQDGGVKPQRLLLGGTRHQVFQPPQLVGRSDDKPEVTLGDLGHGHLE